MPPKRRVPKAPKMDEKLDDSPSEDVVPEVPAKKTKKGKESKKDEKLDDSPPEDVVSVKKTKKGKESKKEEKLNEPPSEEDVPEVPVKNARKGKEPKKEEKVEDFSSEDVPEVPMKNTKKGKGSKKDEKLDDSPLEEDVPEVPVKNTKKGKASKKDEKLDDSPLEEDVPVPVKNSKKGKKSNKVEKPHGKVAADAKLPAKKRGAAKQAEKPDEEVEDTADEKPLKKYESKETEEVPAKRKRGAAKQAEKPDTKDEVEELPSRRRRGVAKAIEQVEDEESDVEVPAKKKGGTKAAAKKTENKAAPSNKTETKWNNINFDSDKKNKEGNIHNLKITSWNVDGIRAWLNKEGLFIMNFNKPDIFCLQETRCSKDKLPDELTKIDDYHAYWCQSQKDGYAGVAVYTKVVPLDIIYGIGNDEHDDEGRCITCEFDGFYLVNVYVPNAGRGLKTLPKRLEWNELFKAFIKKLDEKKPVIVCGDMNVAHNEIDLSNPKGNKKNAGFTQEERDGMSDFLKDGGFVDTFRELYPEEKDAYTFWSYMAKARAKNVGWRLDYFIVSKRISDKVCDNVVNKDVFGSDHCPITLFINI